MAMMDYGSIVKKNGKIIQTDMFMDMKEALGFELLEAKYEYNGNIEKQRVEGNYTSYMGDEELLVCVYKCRATFIVGNKIVKNIYNLNEGLHYGEDLMSIKFDINGVSFHIKRLFGQNRYQMKFRYKGDSYDCIFGYGVDLNIKLWYNLGRKERRFLIKWMKGE